MENFSILVWKDDEKYYVAKNLNLDIVSQWETPEKAIQNLKEATLLYLENNKIEEKNNKSYFLTSFSIQNGKK